jgi:hypothetical protein
MVIAMMRRCLAALLLLVSANALAEINATVDRERIEQNETFTLELTIDSTADTQPDLAPLEKDFHVGQMSRLSNTSIVNGRITRSTTWSVGLRPKRAGQLTIPPVRIGNETSNPVTVSVTEPRDAPPGEADVFITAEVDFEQTYVQAQVLYTIRIYRAVATRQPMLREPAFEGAEVLVELAGDEKSYEAVLNGRAYNVVERSFALFPQESGEVSISPARFEARVLQDGRISGRKVFESDPVTITVRPIPAAPPDYPDAVWLPAREVSIEDNWSREPDELRAGEPISRDITVSALGQLETQIPALEPPDVDGVNVYPDRPVLDRRIETGGIRGMRTDQYAMIGVEDGVITLPKLELPWWDIEAGEWRVATVPERSVTMLPGAEIAPAAPEPAVEPAPAAEPDVTAPATPADPLADLWKLIAEGLAILWILTLLAWYWTAGRPRREKAEKAPAEVPAHRQQSRALKEARKAAVNDDAAGVRRALIEWARLEWPDHPPRSLGELARRVSDPLKQELEALSAASYGRGDAEWDGRATARAIRSFSVADDGDDDTAAGDVLPPLMPRGG